MPCAPINEVRLELTLAQGQTILEALAERPFKQVFELIGHLDRQARAAFGGDSDGTARAPFTFDSAQVRLILEVLGEMPFNRVNGLLRDMHGQMRAAMLQHARQAQETSQADG